MVNLWLKWFNSLLEYVTELQCSCKHPPRCNRMHFLTPAFTLLSVFVVFISLLRGKHATYIYIFIQTPLSQLQVRLAGFEALKRCLLLWRFSTAWYGTVRLGTVRLSSGRFAFPPQFSTAIEWAGLFTRRYNCAASTAVTSS